jgi:hypothetical protein
MTGHATLFAAPPEARARHAGKEFREPSSVRASVKLNFSTQKITPA